MIIGNWLLLFLEYFLINFAVTVHFDQVAFSHIGLSVANTGLKEDVHDLQRHHLPQRTRARARKSLTLQADKQAIQCEGSLFRICFGR